MRDEQEKDDKSDANPVSVTDQLWTCKFCEHQAKASEIKKGICPKCGRKSMLPSQKHSKKVMFDYDLSDPGKRISNIIDLQNIIQKNFPEIWFEVKACLAACATLRLKNLNGCTSLILVGRPSGEKTTVLSFFYGQEHIFLSDDFTPKAFVSQSASATAEELEGIDLLPKIKNKVLLAPELAPLFQAPKDDLISNFAMLTRILDGEGLHRDSGTHGHRGYSGDYKFAWLGATTPLKPSVWNIMNQLGNRLFFLGMKDKNRTDGDYLNMFRGRAYEEKVKECRGAVHGFLYELFIGGVRRLEWDPEKDVLYLPEVIKYAKFLAQLRTSLMLWKREDGSGYEYSFPVTEESPRAINALYNLAKGHAIINGRNSLRQEDLEIVKAVAYSSMPHDRSEFLKLLAKYDGRLTTKNIADELNCSADTAERTMRTFEIIGIVSIKTLNLDGTVGRPLQFIEIKPEFSELLAHTQARNSAENISPQQTASASDTKFSNIVGNMRLETMHTQWQNGMENTKPQENSPVRGLDHPIIAYLKTCEHDTGKIESIATKLGKSESDTLSELQQLERFGDVYSPRPRTWALVQREVVE